MPRELSDILLTIRLMESGNNYTIPKNRGGASGAYQYIDSTWGRFKGYPSAYLAPPHVQDEKALADVESILWTWKGDVSMVPVIWYYPKAAREPALMDIVPMPSAGNRLTVRQYQLRWLDMLAQVTGETYAGLAYLLPSDLRFLGGIPPEVAVSPDELLAVAYPVLGSSVVAPPRPCQAKLCEDGTDAVVYGQKLQPILAAADGVVTSIGVAAAGQLAVTITDSAGRTYRYTGFNDDSPGTSDSAGDPTLATTALVEVGRSVFAGQIIGFMGDTDPMPLMETRGIDPDVPVWPHLRLQIRDAEGVRLDADLLVAAAQDHQACHVGIGPWSSVPDPRRLDDDGQPAGQAIDVSALANGGFHIFPDGTVQAWGNSALILHPRGCQWEPTVAYGAGASGAAAPLRFAVPIDVPVRYWVTGTTAALEQQAAGLLTAVPFTR